MLVVITYSCFTSAFYCAFEFPTEPSLIMLEHLVLVFFSIEIILKCMRLPPEAEASDRSHLKILKGYMKSGWFFLDILATFPFYLFQTGSGGDDSTTLLKLLRMVRIPKIINLLDINRVNKLAELFLGGQPRSKRVIYQMIFKNVFKVIRLVILTVIITYFSGCLFYFVSSVQLDDTLTFLIDNDLNTQDTTDMYKFITVCYFSFATLSTVGYGDLYPISNVEKILTIFIMLAGVGFFSFVMSSFIEIISTFNRNISESHEAAEKFELHNWLTLLTRFRENKPLPNSLYRQINQHFKYYWTNNRLY